MQDPAERVEPSREAMPDAGVGLSKLGQFYMSVYKLILQVSQEGRCTFSLFVLLERLNLLLTRHAFILIRKCAVFNAFYNSLV